IDILERNSTTKFEEVRGLSFLSDGQIINNEQREPTDPNLWPPLPYHKVPGERHIGRTYLGTRTAAYYSSAGCPFLCGFCAIASIYQARWVARAPDGVADDLMELQRRYDINAVEFFDENFFTKEKRTHEFSEKIIGRGIAWWGEGRPDTVMAYSDDTLQAMKRSGCKMIFFGAESSSEEVLQRMHKGGTQTPDTVLQLADRLKHFGIVPEFSFVIGSPSDDIDVDIDRDIKFIRRIKEINSASEIILYMYAPVVFEDSELSHVAHDHGFQFPRTLEDWMKPKWQKFDLRKTPAIPWIKPRHYRKIRSFERVLNGYYPTATDLKLTKFRQTILRAASKWRYQTSTYQFPLEIMVLLRMFHYRQPELEGL
ncbi:MAG: radical SAM protein, partial [Ignavibacteria bacterium]|nr:radical SAM protein [Ignavibacteria bacterium]